MPTSSDAARVAVLVTHEAAGVDDTGIIGDYLSARGCRVIRHQVFATIEATDPDVDLPSLDGVDLVIVFGSTEHAWEEKIRHWVDVETAWVRSALDRGIRVVGICFGSQVLAIALGASVIPTGAVEAGMLTFDVEDGCPVAAGPWFSWHSDIVSIPDGATRWASSAVGPQVFTHGNALGMQFHPEVTRELALEWIDAWPTSLPDDLSPEQFREQVAARVDESQAGCRAMLDWALDAARVS